MKNLVFAMAALAFLGSNAADLITLNSGLNRVRPGRVVAVEALTIAADQPIAISNVTEITEMTNAFATVVEPHIRYDFMLTNFDGNASILTNRLDRFSESFYTVNGTNHVVSGSVTNYLTNLVFTIPNGTLPKATYRTESLIGSGTASGHYWATTPSNAYHLAGWIWLSAGTNDTVNILVD